MTYRDSLNQLATAYSVSTDYRDYQGNPVAVSDDTIIKTLRSLGVRFGNEPETDPTSDLPIAAENPSEEAIWAALQRRHDAEFARPLPRCVVAVAGQPKTFPVHVHDGSPAHVSITLEDGEVRPVPQRENWEPPRTIEGVIWGEATFEIPADTPLGWHTIIMESDNLSASCFLIVTPARVPSTDYYSDNPVSGVMAQLYSVRSEQSWGIGDFGDLGYLAETLAEHADADFLLINPTHAAEPFPPIEDSPYLPTTRRFHNPLYIAVLDIPEALDLPAKQQKKISALAKKFQARNRSNEQLDRNPIYAAKLEALRAIYQVKRDAAREHEFLEFKEREGLGLREFATWCAERAAAHFDDQIATSADFYMWLQWICDAQLGAAQSRAQAAGMKIGIMADLAVGIHPGGADANNLADILAPQASVGAPPDGYNQQGQDWSQPPWHPDRLAEIGYMPWRDLLRTVLRHAGGIRIDHILGLFRLYWIPRMQSPTTGTYVNYDFDALLGILVLEAERANAVVIGEDLGTYEPWVRDVLGSKGVMGTNVMWFEGDLPQQDYRVAALSSLTTHDMPPALGYLAGDHLTLREQLGLLEMPLEEIDGIDAADQARLLNAVRAAGYFGPDAPVADHFEGVPRDQRGDFEAIITALHKFLAGTPSALTCAALVDLVGERRTQNQPGTIKEQYPNWCIPLGNPEGTPILIEDIVESTTFQRLAVANKR
ncbi:MAG: 4-alpha-glucanotransferase [Corynebacterium sp.]|nr:4-alpha-glucanotransferase [Corynebacterium sp.]